MNKKNQLKKIKRRKFITDSAIAAGGLVVAPTVLSSCEDDNLLPDRNDQFTGNFGFLEGVASFDPSQDGIILWTRYTRAVEETESSIVVEWEIATDANFDNVVDSGIAAASESADFTVSVDVSGLTSNTGYYYRFTSRDSDAVSVVGQTKTLPAGSEASSVNMAVVSCANFMAGLFNAYGAIAESEADVVVHLGDYIYEVADDEFGLNANGVDTAALNRLHNPSTEILTISDYRDRYRQYRSDAQLQRAHQLKPFICVWDDHELTNDAFREGAENHNEGEGDFFERRDLAIQVWHEYLPARVTNQAEIFRSFQFGNLVDLHMMDTRIIGRDEQLDYFDFINPTTGELDANTFGAAWLDPTRTILGSNQLTWLQGQLAAGTSTWQVLGSQVLMGRMEIPAELLTFLGSLASNPTPEVIAAFNAVLEELVIIKSRILQGDPTVTEAEAARVNTVLPYNLDAWDGYPAEREAVLGAAAGKNLVSIAGDTHNAWFSNLTEGLTGNRNVVGTEFATPGISSPGFEQLTGTDPAAIAGFEISIQTLINDLDFLDASRRGYMLVEFTAGSANSEWRFLNTLAAEDTSTTAVTRSVSV